MGLLCLTDFLEEESVDMQVRVVLEEEKQRVQRCACEWVSLKPHSRDTFPRVWPLILVSCYLKQTLSTASMLADVSLVGRWTRVVERSTRGGLAVPHRMLKLG